MVHSIPEENREDILARFCAQVTEVGFSMYGFDNNQYYVLSQCPLTALAEETDWTLLADVNEESTTVNGDYISVRGNTPENTYVGSFHYAMSDIYLEGGLFPNLRKYSTIS